VTRSTVTHLKVFRAQPAAVVEQSLGQIAPLGGLCQAFEKATGWSLLYGETAVPQKGSDLVWSAPVSAGVGSAPGHLRIERSGAFRQATEPISELDAASELAGNLATVLGELNTARIALRQREAELAVISPTSAAEDPKRLAECLMAVLQGGAEVIGCHAAAFYLLDDETSTLKLRGAWGLPESRLDDPARSLRGAMADLEALCGHAVVLENEELFQSWSVPEPGFRSAICVPINSPTVPLGTLWMFGHEKRSFSSQQTNLVEIIAGRVGAELQCGALLKQRRRQPVDEPALATVPAIVPAKRRVAGPQLEAWDIAAWDDRSDGRRCAFSDWFSVENNQLTVVVGETSGLDADARTTAAAVQAAARSHGQRRLDVHELLAAVNQTCWNLSPAPMPISLGCFCLEDDTPYVRYSRSGKIGAMLFKADGWESLSTPARPLGTSAKSEFTAQIRILEPGEVLVLYTEATTDREQSGPTLGLEEKLAKQLVPQLGAKAERLIDELAGERDGMIDSLGSVSLGSVIVMRYRG